MNSQTIQTLIKNLEQLREERFRSASTLAYESLDSDDYGEKLAVHQVKGQVEGIEQCIQLLEAHL